jgi:hypothetical protein
MNPISQISSLLTSYNPRFAQADYTPAQRWLDAGCDLSDILRTIRFWTGRKQDIRSLGFFTPYVLATRKPKREPLSPDRLARHYAFLIRRLGQYHPEKERWLLAYEREHGPVAPGQQPTAACMSARQTG